MVVIIQNGKNSNIEELFFVSSGVDCFILAWNMCHNLEKMAAPSCQVLQKESHISGARDIVLLQKKGGRGCDHF